MARKRQRKDRLPGIPSEEERTRAGAESREDADPERYPGSLDFSLFIRTGHLPTDPKTKAVVLYVIGRVLEAAGARIREGKLSDKQVMFLRGGITQARQLLSGDRPLTGPP